MSKNLTKNLSKKICQKSDKKSVRKIYQKIPSKIFQKSVQIYEFAKIFLRLPQKGNLPQVKKHWFRSKTLKAKG